MSDERRIVDAIKTSSVKVVVLLDDAFDPPPFDAKYAGALLEFLADEASKTALTEAGISSEELAAMQDALNKSEYNSSNISYGIARLYARYRETLASSSNPGGMFELKRAMLVQLQPIVELLRQCNELTVRPVGRLEDFAEAAKSADVIFADYYLEAREGADAAKPSYEAVIKMVEQADAGNRPSVVLMSSQDIGAEAENYRNSIRTDTNSLVYASSFVFLRKTDITRAETIWKIANDAADALLDIFQTFDFGRTMHSSLDIAVFSPVPRSRK